MRPGYLAGLDDFWFGNFSGKYFEIQDARSAEPIYTIRDRIQGKTAEEFKALDYGPGWATTLIPTAAVSSMYGRNPYLVSPREWQQLVNNFKEKSQVFKLTG